MSEEEIEIPDDDIEYVNWNNNELVIMKNEILLKRRIGSTNNFRSPISIAGFGLKILYYTLDKIKRKYLYTFYAGGKLFYSYEVNSFLNLKRDKLFEGNLSKNAIRYIFHDKSKNITPKKAEYINGWNDGFKTPINHEERDYMLICHTPDQRIILNSVKEAYKKYSDEEKIKLCILLNNWFNITKYDPICATITAAWSLVSLFKGYFTKHMKLFPHLATEGDRNKGKSAFNDTIITDIWGIHKLHISGLSAKSIALTGKAVSSGAWPLYIDDIQVHSPEFVSMAKEMATSSSEHIKYNPDGSFREKIPKVASLSMSSNTGYLKEHFGDLANNSRAIILHPAVIVYLNKKWIQLGLKIKKAKLLSLVLDYTEGWTDKELSKLVKEVETKYNISERMKKIGNREFINKNYPRIKEIYIIILVGVLLWEKIFNIKLKMVDEILETLIKSRGFMLSELVNYFLVYCKEAKEYFYDDINETTEKPIPKNHPAYLKHELIINSKGIGLFTVANLKDFSRMCDIKFKGLKDLCNQIVEGLEKENKDWLHVHDTTYKGQNIYCIKVSKEILGYDMREIDEPYINPTEQLSDEELEEKIKSEMEDKEDESVELDFDDLVLE